MFMFCPICQCLVSLVSDIEAALQKIDEVKSNQEGIAAEEALILRGYALSPYLLIVLD
jgi:hypothetical protein